MIDRMSQSGENGVKMRDKDPFGTHETRLQIHAMHSDVSALPTETSVLTG